MFNDDDNYSNAISMSFDEEVSGVERHVRFVLSNKECYTDIVDTFVHFLNAVGYTYIGGISVLDENGEILHTTSF